MANRAMLEEREPATPATPSNGSVDRDPNTVEPAAVRLQLHRLVESPSFRSSKRCRHFLEQVVEHSLTAGTEPLKERAVGMLVFGREPSYDTAADPIVRVTAGEIRRRLGQYYAEPAHQRELRVDLPAGSYTPIFSWPHGEPSPIAASAAAPVADPSLPTATLANATESASAVRWPRRIFGIISLVALLLVLGSLAMSQQPSSSFDRFWAPLIHSKTPVLLCTGSIDVYELPGRIKRAADRAAAAAPAATATAGAAGPTSSADAQAPAPDPLTLDAREVQRVGAGFVSVADAVAIVRLASLFQERGTPYRVRENRATSFADLRTSPTVLIGMFSNAWTLQLGSDFRFVPLLERGTGRILIQDRQHPERTDWFVQRPWPALTVTRDYALVSRVFDPVTGTMVVIGAGITPFGTTAAAEFLTSPQHLEPVLRQAPHDWPTKNLQIVLETRVIDGAAAPPHVLATHFW